MVEGGERKETVTSVITDGNEGMEADCTETHHIQLTGNVTSRILSEGAYQISVCLQVHAVDLGREHTTLDLSSDAYIKKNDKEAIQVIPFALSSYIF